MIGIGAIPVFVDGLAHITDPLGSELRAQIAIEEDVRALLWIPADPSAPTRGAWARTHGAQVLAITNRRILVGAEATRRGEPRWVILAYEHILTWTIEEHLLHGLLHVTGTGDYPSDGAWLEFHTHGHDEVRDALAPLEQALLGLERSPDCTDEHRQAMDDLPLFLATPFRQTLLPGEVVRTSLFQPIILRQSLLTGQRQVAPPTLIVATDRRLIVFREGILPHTQIPRYGQSITSMPCYRATDLVVRIEYDLVLLTYEPNPQMLRVLLDHDYRATAQHLLRLLHTQQSSAPGCVTQRLDKC